MTIKITVKTRHIAEQSDPKNHRFVFAYTVDTAQLLNRYWLITDSNGKKVEVQGAGVVGEQPVIAPNKSYSYTSGCILETELGTMEGHYEFQNEQKDTFKQPIPVFRLSIPNIIH